MYQKRTKLWSFTLALVMIAVFIPVNSVSAYGEFTENAVLEPPEDGICADFSEFTSTGNPVDDIVACAVAQNGRTGDSLGYSYPPYENAWCAAFVSDCAYAVGQSQAIPWNGSCNSLRTTIINAGGYYVSTPQKGDIVFWGGNHVALMIDSVNCVHGNIDDKVFICSLTYDIHNGSPTHYVRPNYTSTPPPEAPVVSLSQTYFTENQDICITWNAVNGASSYQYYLSEYPEGYAYTTNVENGNTTATSITFKGSKLKNGRYSFFLHARNSGGESSQSNWVSFDIYADDYIPVKTAEYNGHLYALYDNEMSWSFARNLCKNMGGHLATVRNQAEEDFLEGLIQSGKKDAYWLGGTNFETTAEDVFCPYKWVTGESFSYTNWKAGEPSFSGERGIRERFLELRKSYGNKWNDVCNTNKKGKGFILEIEVSEKDDIVKTSVYNGHTYYIVDRNTTWTEAKAYCEKLGGHLVCINSKNEEAFLNELINYGTRYWYYVGAVRKESKWIWLDGTAANDISWNGALWGSECNYLMKYKKQKTYINLPNTYYPAHDIKNIGFICEVDNHNPFVDVKESDFFFNPVMWAVGNEVTSGRDATHFAPHETVKRSEAMLFFYAAKGRPKFTTTTSPFRDVKKKHWFYDAVLWAVENKITSGTDATHFSPNKTCIRSEILQFLYAAMDKPGYTIENPYSDIKDKHWYKDGAIWAYEKGLEKGENGKFKAKTPCTRAYVVTYLYRFITGKELVK